MDIWYYIGVLILPIAIILAAITMRLINRSRPLNFKHYLIVWIFYIVFIAINSSMSFDAKTIIFVLATAILGGGYLIDKHLRGKNYHILVDDYHDLEIYVKDVAKTHGVKYPVNHETIIVFGDVPQLKDFNTKTEWSVAIENYFKKMKVNHDELITNKKRFVDFAVFLAISLVMYYLIKFNFGVIALILSYMIVYFRSSKRSEENVIFLAKEFDRHHNNLANELNEFREIKYNDDPYKDIHDLREKIWELEQKIERLKNKRND